MVTEIAFFLELGRAFRLVLAGDFLDFLTTFLRFAGALVIFLLREAKGISSSLSLLDSLLDIALRF